ncbi:MAG: universal stress protein [Acidimicrobiia bacterium]
MPDTIIVPLDGSDSAERALGLAAVVADRTGAEVVVLTARQGGVVVDPKAYLTEVAEAAGIANPRPVVIDDRLAASAIVLVASEARDPAVCMTTHARGGPGHALFGSVAEETLGRAAAPILLVGPRMPVGVPELRHLVVCLDGSDVASAIIPSVSAWARALGIDVTLVNVFDPEQPVDLEQVANDLEADCGPVAWKSLSGRNAADAIVDFAAARPGTLLALTSHGRTGLARLAIGSVTMAVVRNATCPILTVRPSGLE